MDKSPVNDKLQSIEWVRVVEGEHPNIIHTTDEEIVINEEGVGWEYFNKMKNHKDKVAQIDALSGEKDTYESLLNRAIRTAITMKKQGLKPGDFISICSRQNLNNCVPQIAAYFIGVVVASVDPSLSVKESVYLLKQVSPKIIFSGVESVHLMEKVVEELNTDVRIVVLGKASNENASFGDFLIPDQEETVFIPSKPTNLNETVVVIFTTGTTGMPKGLRYNHRTILSSVNQFGLNVNAVGYFTASQFWAVYVWYLQVCTLCGLTRLILPCFDDEDPWKAFQYDLSFAGLNATNAMALANTEEPKHVKKNLYFLFVWGTMLPLKYKEKLRKCFPNTIVQFSYGLTEVLSTTLEFPLFSYSQLRKSRPNSVGTIKRGISYKVVNSITEEILGPNQPGELRVKAKLQFDGYINEDYSTPFDSDGWLKTGDLVYYDEDLCFYVTGRVKENFKYKNQYIVPSELEDVLMLHDSVKFAAVVGKPHDIEGYHPMGLVVLMQGGKNVTAEEIEKFVEERVEDRKRLRAGIKIVPSLPITITGKICRFKLNQMIENNEI